MKFEIKTEVFAKAVRAVTVIATKNVKKCGERHEPFHLARLISLEATSQSLCLKAYGGTASIAYTITTSDSYVPTDSGCVIVLALELQSALKSSHLEEELLVRIDNDQLKIAPKFDEDDFISVPIIGKKIIPYPNSSKKNDQITIVNREYFVKGLQSIKFAPAYEDKLFSYKCVLFDSWNNSFRFSSGTGGRFVIDEFEGKKTSTNETKMIIPSINVANIIDVFKHSDQQAIKIRSVGVDHSKKIPEQIVMETDNISLAIYDLEYFTKYPNLNPIINYAYPYQISIRAKDWKYVMEAIAASRHSSGDSLHNTRITADLLHGYFDLKTNTEMRMNKKIAFEPGVFVIDPKKDKSYKPWFCCNSEYLQEISKVAGKEDVIIVNFKDQSEIEGLDDKQVQKAMKPTLIKFPEKIYKDGVSEKFFMFFSVSTKW